MPPNTRQDRLTPEQRTRSRAALGRACDIALVGELSREEPPTHNLRGGLSALARCLGLSPQAVARWKERGVVPPGWVIQIEEISGGAAKRHELAPDLYPE